MSVPFKFKQPYRDLFAFLGNNKPIPAAELGKFIDLLPASIPKEEEIRSKYELQGSNITEETFMAFIAEVQKALNVPFDEILWGYVSRLIQFNLFAGNETCDLKEVRSMLDPLTRMYIKDEVISKVYVKHCPDGGKISSRQLAQVVKDVAASNVSLTDLLRMLNPKKIGGKSTSAPITKPSAAPSSDFLKVDTSNAAGKRESLFGPTIRKLSSSTTPPKGSNKELQASTNLGAGKGVAGAGAASASLLKHSDKGAETSVIKAETAALVTGEVKKEAAHVAAITTTTPTAATAAGTVPPAAAGDGTSVGSAAAAVVVGGLGGTTPAVVTVKGITGAEGAPAPPPAAAVVIPPLPNKGADDIIKSALAAAAATAPGEVTGINNTGEQPYQQSSQDAQLFVSDNLGQGTTESREGEQRGPLNRKGSDLLPQHQLQKPLIPASKNLVSENQQTTPSLQSLTPFGKPLPQQPQQPSLAMTASATRGLQVVPIMPALRPHTGIPEDVDVLTADVISFVTQLEHQRGQLQQLLEDEIANIASANNSIKLLSERMRELEKTNQAFLRVGELLRVDDGQKLFAVPVNSYDQNYTSLSNNDIIKVSGEDHSKGQKDQHEVMYISPFAAVLSQRQQLAAKMQEWLQRSKEENDLLRQEIMLLRRREHYDATSAAIGSIISEQQARYCVSGNQMSPTGVTQAMEYVIPNSGDIGKSTLPVNNLSPAGANVFYNNPLRMSQQLSQFQSVNSPQQQTQIMQQRRQPEPQFLNPYEGICNNLNRQQPEFVGSMPPYISYDTVNRLGVFPPSQMQQSETQLQQFPRQKLPHHDPNAGNFNSSTASGGNINNSYNTPGPLLIDTVQSPFKVAEFYNELSKKEREMAKRVELLNKMKFVEERREGLSKEIEKIEQMKSNVLKQVNLQQRQADQIISQLTPRREQRNEIKRLGIKGAPENPLPPYQKLQQQKYQLQHLYPEKFGKPQSPVDKILVNNTVRQPSQRQQMGVLNYGNDGNKGGMVPKPVKGQLLDTINNNNSYYYQRTAF